MTRYHPLLVVLHWLLALMIIVALVMGSTSLDPIPNDDPAKIDGLVKTLGADARSKIIAGADEVDLVRSGLEETMVNAFAEIAEFMLADDRVETMRTAAFAIAIEKVARSYMELGVFP